MLGGDDDGAGDRDDAAKPERNPARYLAHRRAQPFHRHILAGKRVCGMKVLGSVSRTGGSGKTTLATSLAVLAEQAGPVKRGEKRRCN